MWAKVQTNLEWTINNPGARACAVDKILHHGKNAYNAFAACNDAFRDRGLIRSNSNDYKDCNANVCNWFTAQIPPWSPACN